MQDFIKTWDNELDAEYCQTVIDYYNAQQGTRILNRQTANEKAPKMNKDGSMLYDEGETACRDNGFNLLFFLVSPL